ncbi:hypothetical protein VB735_30770 [Halotia wernerae UHCC 0503]|nr:hypothetical protein [Halotia wernerae UHCC 0503]
MLKYFDPTSTMTLHEAIQELRAVEEQKRDVSVKMSSGMMQAFEHHDAVHVLFGCGTAIQDEIAAHAWMVFGTTAKLSEMHHAVANREHRNVLLGIGHFKLFSIWVGCLPRIFTIIIKCLRMKKRLALEELAKLKEQPLCDIRREYGIVV